MTEDVQYKQLPRFDRHVEYWPLHNAQSEAVLQLQGLVHELRQEVAELKAAQPETKTSSRSTKAASK